MSEKELPECLECGRPMWIQGPYFTCSNDSEHHEYKRVLTHDEYQVRSRRQRLMHRMGMKH